MAKCTFAAMIAVSNISVSFSGHDLFKGISFFINKKDRIGLVGKNGVGKSTLMKIIMGKQVADGGSIDISGDATIGYLPQEINATYKGSVYEETMTVFSEIHALEAKIADINTQLSERTDYESDGYMQLIEDLNVLHDKLQVHDSGKLEMQVEKVLKGLGFKQEEFTRPLDTFSGGWQMRVELAKILLRNPDLLLLDEPTNHLDIESILWLEDYLKQYPGAIIMISHDRMFLDNVTNRTIEIVFGKIYDFKVPYTKYMELREERYEQQLATIKNQQKHIAEQEAFIERFKAKASKAKQAQSKLKQLEKMERLDADELDESTIAFRFPPAPRSGNIAVNAKKLHKSYGEKEVLDDVFMTINRGEHVAFVGKNGMGKSTMVKMIIGETGFDGDLDIGHNVDIGYYAQIQEKSLDPENTVLESIEAVALGEWRKEHKMRALLGAFLFGEKDVDKKVKVLSGGEKSRLALAKLLMHPYNLLILDEPTNHLDISSKEMLKEALQSFDGTLIVVSHDRDFLHDLTDKTYEFANGGVKEHLGTINEFLNKYKADHFRAFEQAAAKPKAETKAPTPATEDKPKGKKIKEQAKAERSLKKKLNNVENAISKTEEKIATLEKQMADPSLYDNDDKSSQDLFFEHAELKQYLDRKMKEWETISEELEGI